MTEYVCAVRDAVCDPEVGDPDDIEPDTTSKDLPDERFCPECVEKDEFETVEGRRPSAQARESQWVSLN